MAYDEELAGWVRAFMKGERAVEEKRMFGGLGMLVGGNMAVAVRGKGGLLVRVDPESGGDLLREPGAKMMKMRGKSMPGWITVDPEATHHPFSVWDHCTRAFRTVPGDYTVYVGTSADDTPHTATVTAP